MYRNRDRFSFRAAASWLLGISLIAGLAAAEEGKDMGPGVPSPFGVEARATGGPDVFGYTFADQDEDTCAFELIDISATGTLVEWGFGGSDDNSSGALALEAPFDFYGTDYDELAMSTNGYLSTDPDDPGTTLGTGNPPSMCPLPAELLSGGGARLYPLLDDLVTDTAYFEYFADCPRAGDRCRVSEDCTIFQWDDTHHFGNSDETFDVQAILYHDTSDIVFSVGTGNPELGAASTTGIQAAPETPGPPYPTSVPLSGLTYTCDSGDSVLDDSAVCFFHPDPIPDACVFSDLVISKETDAAERVEPGTEVVYTLSVTNDGPDDARNAVVTDDLGTLVSYLSDDCGAGAPSGSVWTWTTSVLPTSNLVACNITVEVIGARGETVTNTAEVDLDNFDPDTTSNTSTVSFDIGFISDLAITKTSDAGDRVRQGESVSYTLTVTNAGPDSAVAAVVTDELPTGITYDSNDCGAAAPSGQTFTWEVGDLTSSGTATCTLTATVTGEPGETVDNSASVAVENTDPELADNVSGTVSFQIGPVIDLGLDKIVLALDEEARQVTYGFAAGNAGPDDGEDVVVSDELPGELEWVSDDCGAGAPVDGTWTWDLGDLSAGGAAACTAVFDISPFADGEITNAASVTGFGFDTDSGNNDASASFTIAIDDSAIFADGFESGDTSGWD